MKHFSSINDLSHPQDFVRQACALKHKISELGQLGTGKTLGMIFLNPSLRTRLSTQKAATLLGMNVIPIDISTQGWGLELKDGICMNGGAGEHIKEAAAVLGRYCDILAIRSFPSLEDREADYQDLILDGFKRYAGVPVINMESATGHPLQAIADYMTILEKSPVKKPKVVLTWAPHIKALPQSVANSFAILGTRMEVDLTIANPLGFDLWPEVTAGATITHDQKQAFADADFIYAKNWSSFEDYGAVGKDLNHWMITPELMSLTNHAKFMHCLPVRRNLVVHEAVLDDGPSVVIDQAENRVYSAAAVLAQLLEDAL